MGAAVLGWVALYEVNLPLWDWVVYDLVGLAPASRLGSGVHFFFYDSIKIALLLIGIIFLVTVLRSFMSVERTRALLGGKREGVGNVMAAGLGVITPFCSCSAVPAFIGFVAAGVPLGVTMSFLIASPLVNEVAIDPSAGLTWDDRIQMGVEEVGTILRKIWPYLLAGIALGAAIHGWAPEDFFTRYAGAGNPFAVLIAVLIGIPLYSNAAGIMPLVQALHDKGLPMGTLLAFMMAVVALSLPELILLRRVLKPPLIATFVAVTGAGIIAVGYLFNAVIPA